MYVPPLFPEPESVARNIAAAPYDARLAFIRKVVHGHTASILAVGVLAVLLPQNVTTGFAAFVAIGALILLSAIRRLAQGSRLDLFLSGLVVPMLAMSLAQTFRSHPALSAAGIGIVVAVIMALLYMYACGRDFSFLGQFTLSGAAASIALAIFSSLGYATWFQSSVAIGSAWVYLAYYSYDLASLLQRRRDGEVIEAVVDLYRDSLNFITYGFRVWHHWRTIRM